MAKFNAFYLKIEGLKSLYFFTQRIKMLITQKKVWYFLFFVLVTIVLWLNFNPSSTNTQQTSIQSVNNTTEKINTFSKIEHQKISTPEKEKKISLDSPHTEKNNSNDYMTHLSELYKQRKKDPRILLKMESIPEEEQAQLKEWLNKYKEQGYINSDEIAFDYIEQQESQASFINLNDPSITLNLQDIENTSFAQYKYLGTILDGGGIPSTEHTNVTGLTRLYTDDDGTTISLRENAINNSNQGSIIIDEFVSNRVHDYPVTIMKSCATNVRCITKLTLITSDKMYEISIKDDKNSNSDEYLLEMASSLELPKLPKQQM